MGINCSGQPCSQLFSQIKPYNFPALPAHQPGSWLGFLRPRLLQLLLRDTRGILECIGSAELKGWLRGEVAASNNQGFAYMNMRNQKLMIPWWYLRWDILLGRHLSKMHFPCDAQPSLSCRTLGLRGFWQQALSPSLPSQCQICQVSRSPLQESLALGTVALREVKAKQQLGLSVMQWGFGHRR